MCCRDTDGNLQHRALSSWPWCRVCVLCLCYVPLGVRAHAWSALLCGAGWLGPCVPVAMSVGVCPSRDYGTAAPLRPYCTAYPNDSALL